MAGQTAADRHRELCSAFAALAEENPELHLLPHHSPLEVVLGGNAPGPIVTLLVSEHEARVRASSGPDSGGTSVLEDTLTVDLSNGYAWDDVTFDNAPEMAHYLHKHMRRRLKAVSQVKP